MIREVVRENPNGWVVVTVTFFVLALVFSARSALGLLMPFWEEDLGWPRTFLSTGGAILLIVMAVASPLAGNAIDRFGPRAIYAPGLAVVGLGLILSSMMTGQWQFILFFCLLAGLGFGAVAVPLASTTIALYFDRFRGLATGLATSGASGGQLLVVPALAGLVLWLGWRPGLALFGGLILLTAPVCWFLIKGGGVGGTGSGSRDTLPLGRRLGYIASSPTFWLLFFGFVICGFTTSGVIEIHLIPYAAACGFATLTSATAYGVLHGFNMAGMISAGFLADIVPRPLLLGGIYFARGLTFIILMYIPGDPVLLFTFAVLFGIFDYSVMPVIASLVTSHIGVRIMGLTLGVLFAGHSVGAAAGSFLGGYLFDKLATYDWTWSISIALAMAAAVMSFMIREQPKAPPEPAMAAA